MQREVAVEKLGLETFRSCAPFATLIAAILWLTNSPMVPTIERPSISRLWLQLPMIVMHILANPITCSSIEELRGSKPATFDSCFALPRDLMRPIRPADVQRERRSEFDIRQEIPLASVCSSNKMRLSDQGIRSQRRNNARPVLWNSACQPLNWF